MAPKRDVELVATVRTILQNSKQGFCSCGPMVVIGEIVGSSQQGFSVVTSVKLFGVN